MKKIILPILLISIVALPTLAQENKIVDKRAKMEAEKNAYLTEKIGLTTDQAAKFWPIYNEYKRQTSDIRKRERALRQKVSNTTEKVDYKAINEEYVALEAERAALFQTYYTRYRAVLSEEQIFKYFEAERNYKGELLNKIGAQKAVARPQAQN